MPARRAAALLALAFAAFYAATTRGQFVFGDDVLVFQVAEAMLDGEGFAVRSPADRGDVARAVEGRDGRGYSKYGLGLSVAALPFALAGRAAERAGVDLPLTRDAEGNARTGTLVFATGLTNAAAGALAVAALFWLATETGFTAGVATLLAAALGGATFFAHYAATFLSEPLAAAALAGAAAAALRARNLVFGRDAGISGLRAGGGETQRRSVEGGEEGATPVGWAGSPVALAALSGALAGFAVLVKTVHLVAALPIGIWLLVSLARAPRARGAAGEASRRARIGRFSWRPFLVWSLCFFVFVAAVAGYNAARFGSPFETGYGEEATRFTVAVGEGLAGLLVSPGKGVLWYAPPLLLALAGARAFRRRRPAAAALLLAATVPSLLLHAAYYQWHGGGAWGPRFLAPLLPLWLLPAGEVLARAAAGRGRARWAAAAALGAGILVVLLAALVPFDRYHQRVWPDPLAPDPVRLARMVWRPADSPLAVHGRALPGALVGTFGLLSGRAPLPGPDEKGRAGLPDLAFARYGSHALLQWTRAFGVLGLLAGAAAAVAAARAQKASLSRPPQY